ncbi:hypothetical protein CWI38_2261p0020 [Hamiltosporidium tvaerminnensis]|uniref:Uncharacterized protein n=1 Tax=Hamiltosporidium tvaerminnensis TaxID=1176355 RepID=A0A4Q9LLU1_9MICR|nr:hypothetical protein CWI38_2261p0020 [Hamiltosporidium tvaerminnensis]
MGGDIVYSIKIKGVNYNSSKNNRVGDIVYSIKIKGVNYNSSKNNRVLNINSSKIKGDKYIDSKITGVILGVSNTYKYNRVLNIRVVR